MFIFQIRKMCVDTCKGMTYLHSVGICHRDLKTGNLLVDKDWNIKVADFGLARLIGDVANSQAMTACGTPAYAAPELLRQEKYSFKVDVFSFGVCMWEMFSRQKPHEGATPYQVVLAVATQGLRPKIHASTPRIFTQIIRRCWSNNSKRRPSFSELHATFSVLQCPPPTVPNPIRLNTVHAEEDFTDCNMTNGESNTNELALFADYAGHSGNSAKVAENEYPVVHQNYDQFPTGYPTTTSFPNTTTNTTTTANGYPTTTTTITTTAGTTTGTTTASTTAGTTSGTNAGTTIISSATTTITSNDNDRKSRPAATTSWSSTSGPIDLGLIIHSGRLTPTVRPGSPTTKQFQGKGKNRTGTSFKTPNDGQEQLEQQQAQQSQQNGNGKPNQ